MTAIVAAGTMRPARASGYQRFTRTSGFVFLVLGVTFAIPSGLTYIFLTSSQAAGTGAMAALVAFLLAPVVRVRIRIFASLMLAAVICGHFFVARNMIPVNVGRFTSSLGLLMGMVVAAHFMARWLSEVPDAAQRRALAWLRVAMIVIAILSIAHIEPQRWDTSIPEKAIFPFTEHSHFALVFTPLLLDGCVRARGLARPAWLIGGLLVALLLQNLTVLIGVALVAIITAPLWQLLVLLVMTVGAATSLDLSYYLSRLDLSTGTTNLSALVYIQGYEFIVDSFGLTSGWGMGFQQLGVIPMNSPASNAIFILTGGSTLNLNDGGFGASKVISEFGIVGIVATTFLLGIIIVFSLRLRRMALKIPPAPATILPYCFIVGFTIEMFVRGIGYFSATVFMLIVSFLLLRFNVDRRKAADRVRRSTAPVAAPPVLPSSGMRTRSA